MDPLRYYEQYWNQGEPPPESDPTTPERATLLLGALGPLRAERGRPLKVLDAGCGSGLFLERLEAAGHGASGFDASRTAADEARRRLTSADVRVGSLEETLPYADASFDAVWCTEVIEHLFDADRFLAEAARVLAPGGLLLLTTPYHGLLKNLAIALLGFDRHFDPAGPHIRFFSVASLRAALARAGLEYVSWSPIGRVRPLCKSMFVVTRKAGVCER